MQQRMPVIHVFFSNARKWLAERMPRLSPLSALLLLLRRLQRQGQKNNSTTKKFPWNDPSNQQTWYNQVKPWIGFFIVIWGDDDRDSYPFGFVQQEGGVSILSPSAGASVYLGPYEFWGHEPVTHYPHLSTLYPMNHWARHCNYRGCQGFNMFNPMIGSTGDAIKFAMLG